MYIRLLDAFLCTPLNYLHVTHAVHILQWKPSNVDTIGTPCPEYRGICVLEASGIFPVGLTMHTCAVECYEGVGMPAIPNEGR